MCLEIFDNYTCATSNCFNVERTETSWHECAHYQQNGHAYAIDHPYLCPFRKFYYNVQDSEVACVSCRQPFSAEELADILRALDPDQERGPHFRQWHPAWGDYTGSFWSSPSSEASSEAEEDGETDRVEKAIKGNDVVNGRANDYDDDDSEIDDLPELRCGDLDEWPPYDIDKELIDEAFIRGAKAETEHEALTRENWEVENCTFWDGHRGESPSIKRGRRRKSSRGMVVDEQGMAPLSLITEICDDGKRATERNEKEKEKKQGEGKGEDIAIHTLRSHRGKVAAMKAQFECNLEE